VLSTVSSKDHSSSAVQYTLKFVNELLVAASEKAVAIVQPRDNETVNQSNGCTTIECTSTTLDTAQRTVAASSKLVDVNSDRQVGVEQHTEITNAGRRLYGRAGW